MQRESDHYQEVHFRVNRFHCTNGYWYFVTREGANVGPYESRMKAEIELAQFLEAKTTSSVNS